MNLTIKQGEFVCIVGDVGSGKSSLLNSIIGDLLYASPEFAAKYRNTNQWSTNELKLALKMHG